MSRLEHKPLNGLRVADLCEGIGDGCRRHLADLDPAVLLVEAPISRHTQKIEKVWFSITLTVPIKSSWRPTLLQSPRFLKG